jgi:hypothetical protein
MTAARAVRTVAAPVGGESRWPRGAGRGACPARSCARGDVLPTRATLGNDRGAVKGGVVTSAARGGLLRPDDNRVGRCGTRDRCRDIGATRTTAADRRAGCRATRATTAPRLDRPCRDAIWAVQVPLLVNVWVPTA